MNRFEWIQLIERAAQDYQQSIDRSIPDQKNDMAEIITRHIAVHIRLFATCLKDAMLQDANL